VDEPERDHFSLAARDALKIDIIGANSRRPKAASSA
jgi:hypothetical protein